MKFIVNVKVGLLLVAALVIAISYQACTNASASHQTITFTDDAEIIRSLNKILTETLKQDGFPPPNASRAFAYSNIAAYEALMPVDTGRVSFVGQLNGLDSMPTPAADKPINTTISMVVAFTKVANSIIYRDHIINKESDTLLAKLELDMEVQVVNNSVEWGNTVADAIIAWSKKDKFKETRNMPRYEVRENDPSAWLPTPPKYIPALEPHWAKIRSFSMDSAGQFSPGLPVAFSAEKGSEFYNIAYEVYETVNNATDERLPIALFWDCNPLVSENFGHYMSLRRQLSPGAHWINITRVATELDSADLCRSTEAYALVSIALADAFISCWHEKYSSNLIRPETYINRYIDPDWKPLLETPMFPEHTSGHSVISTAAATVLTDLFGNELAFVDSTNVPYDRPPRSFTSFRAAADEAATSRLYGGIHFRPAIELGQKQGEDLALNLLKRVKTRKQLLQ